MPETSPHLNDCLVFRQNDVRRSGEVLFMQTKPKVVQMEKGTDDHLRLSILRVDSAHIPAALFFAEEVHIKSKISNRQ